MFTKLRNSFITGVVIILPAIGTIMIVRFLVIKTNSIIIEPVMRNFPPILAEGAFVYLAKALVFLGVVLLVILIGLGARIILLRKLFGFVEKVFSKVPMVNRIYNGIKQISNAFLGQSKGLFRKVVLIEYPRKGIYSIGFVTIPSKGEVRDKAGKDLLNVFIPTTPNPTSGLFLLVPEEETILLDMSVEDGLKLVISGGTVVPPAPKKQ